MESKLKLLARSIALISLLLTIFSVYCNNIDSSNDFGWHLKNGEFIWQNHKLPEKDYFSFTSDTPDYLRNIGLNAVAEYNRPANYKYGFTTLTHSWLGQVMIYASYLAGGLIGVVLMKSLVFVVTFILLYLTLRKSGSGFGSSFFVMLLVAWVGVDFTSCRPQIFSFFLFVSMVYLLYDYKNGGRKFYILPPMMFLWANIHAGFIVGFAGLATYAAGEFSRYLYTGYYRKESLSEKEQCKIQHLILVTFIAFFAGLANPNGYTIYLSGLEAKTSLYGPFIQEFQRPLLNQYPAYWVILSLCIVFMVFSLKRLTLAEIFFVLFFIFWSLNTSRLMIFFSLGSSVVLAQSMSHVSLWLAERAWFKKITKTPFFNRIAAYGIYEIIVASAATVFFVYICVTGRAFRFEFGASYPEKAVNYIKVNQFPKNLFNEFEWGSYLIWNLPQYPVFIDGRCLNETTLFHYRLITSAVNENMTDGLIWKQLLDAYKIELILTSALERGGPVRPLVRNLFFDPQWDLVYRDGAAIVFLKGTPENRSRYRRSLLPKQEGIYNEIIAEGQKVDGLYGASGVYWYYKTFAELLMDAKNYEKAKDMYIRCLEINPNNKYIENKIMSIDGILNSAQ